MHGDKKSPDYLSIAQFAQRSGMASSRLRFYERRGLLLPATRLANGYRAYSQEQVAEAQLICSLRETGMSIASIRTFLGLDACGRRELLSQWSHEVALRQLSIQIARQYLDRLQPDRPQVFLRRWDAPSFLLWFPAAAPPGPLPFAAALEARARQLRRLGIPVLSGGYARSLDLSKAGLAGEVGFQVEARSRRLPAEARLESVAPLLFAELECGLDDDKAAHRIFRFLDDFGYVPAGRYLERYMQGVNDRYLLMIAIAPASEKAGLP
jgi:DNA-binding transcriptional MerR regulator